MILIIRNLIGKKIITTCYVLLKKNEKLYNIFFVNIKLFFSNFLTVEIITESVSEFLEKGLENSLENVFSFYIFVNFFEENKKLWTTYEKNELLIVLSDLCWKEEYRSFYLETLEKRNSYKQFGNFFE